MDFSVKTFWLEPQNLLIGNILHDEIEWTDARGQGWKVPRRRINRDGEL